jgi:hypothetical protein
MQHTEIAAQDKSMPPVKIIIVWPRAKAPIIETCCSIRERFPGVKKFELKKEKENIAMIKTLAEDNQGYLCK